MSPSIASFLTLETVSPSSPSFRSLSWAPPTVFDSLSLCFIFVSWLHFPHWSRRRHHDHCPGHHPLYLTHKFITLFSFQGSISHIGVGVATAIANTILGTFTSFDCLIHCFTLFTGLLLSQGHCHRRHKHLSCSGHHVSI